MNCSFVIAIVAVIAAAATAAPSPKASREAVCYYGSWATYRAWPGAYHVADIDASLCTHLVYAFAGLDAQSLEVISLDPYNDLEENWGKGSYKKFAAIAAKNPHVTTLLAVGGWNEGSRKYSDVRINQGE
ncbi:Probable chitinase 2, partial [Gryllus bimaculatus]